MFTFHWFKTTENFKSTLSKIFTTKQELTGSNRVSNILKSTKQFLMCIFRYLSVEYVMAVKSWQFT